MMSFLGFLVAAFIGTAAAQPANPVGPCMQGHACYITGGTQTGADISTNLVEATGGNTLRTTAARAADTVNVLDYGASASPTLDTNRTGINAAIVAANAKPQGGEVFLPAGTYYVNLANGGLSLLSSVTIRGAGKGRTKILCDDTGVSLPTAATCMRAVGSTSGIHVKDITFKGYADTNNVLDQVILDLGQCTNCSVEDNEFINGRSLSVFCNLCDQVLVRGNYVFDTLADGIAIWNTPNASIIGNILKGTGDDSISMNINSGYAAPIRSGLVVADNSITESYGIKALGAKVIAITGNKLQRILAHAIVVNDEGSTLTPVISVNVTGNTISDVFHTPSGWAVGGQVYISVGGGPKGSAGHILDFGSDSSGTLYANDTGASTTTPGGGWINISDNVIQRTLPPVTQYTQWGYGCLWQGQNAGGCYDGAITEANLNTRGFQIDYPARTWRIAHNIIATSGVGILLNNTSAAALDWDGFDIEGNILSDCQFACIWSNAGSSVAQRIRVAHNHFDGDPRFVSTNRGANGTWAAGGSGSVGVWGIYAPNLTGLSVIGNNFRNVVNPLSTGADYERSNVQYATPAATGFSASNVGIGNIRASGSDWSLVVEDSNQNSGTYGAITTSPVATATAMPSSGTWVSGTFVQNSAPTNTFPPVSGWIRLTTGSGNTLHTDWETLYLGYGIGSGVATGDQNMAINSAAGNGRYLYMDTASLCRWRAGASGVAESGGNAGSNFVITRCDDSGVAIDNPIAVDRASGQVGIANDLALAGIAYLGVHTIGAGPTQLPTCNGDRAGALTWVNDALAPAWNVALAGTGAVSVLAFCDGTNWIAH